MSEAASRMPIEIREAGMDDAEILAALFTTLGYLNSTEEVQARLMQWPHDDSNRVFLAEWRGQPVGVAVFHRTPFLHEPGATGRVTALVVDEDARGQGVGQALVRHVEAFAASVNCMRLEVTCAEERQDAHRFYRALGYAIHKLRFVKALPGAGHG